MLTGKGEPFCWGESQEKSFRNLKDTISSDLELAIFDPQAPTIVTVDASDVGLGAQLTQIYNGREVPVQFASHTLVDRERNFATNEKEALSCIWAIEHWEKFLLGHHFTLRTDHGALRSLLHQHSSTRKLAKFERWVERLSRFDYTVEHVRGTHNYITDALSRLSRPASEQPPPPAVIDDELPELQATIDYRISSARINTLLHQVKEYIRTAWPPKASVPTSFLPYYNVRSELSIDHECVVRCDKRFVIPASLQCRILHIAHEGPPGIVRAKRVSTSHLLVAQSRHPRRELHPTLSSLSRQTHRTMA